MPTVYHRFARFAAVGVVATATHTLVFAAAIELARIEPVTANAMAFVVAVLVGFILNREWTFASHREHASLWRYFVGALAGLAANSLIMYFATHVMGWSPYLGLLAALMVVPAMTFALNQYWVFRPRANDAG